MENSKNWKTVALFISLLILLPVILYGPKLIHSFFNPDVYTSISSLDGKTPSVTEVDNHSSEIVTLLLHTIWTISSLWLAM
jgi:hypothetical protein